MNEPDLDPLDGELRQLLDVERARPPVAPHLRGRLLSRVEASVLAGAAGVAAGSALAGSASGGGTSAALGKVATKNWFAVILAFAIGGAVGAGITHATRTRPVERIVYVEKHVEKPSEIAPTAAPPAPPTVPAAVITGPIEDLSAPLPSSLAAPPTPVSHAASAPAAASVSAKAEQQAIDAIRAALMRKDSAAALDAVSVHEARFAKGQQVEEREALAVQALSLSGRNAEAKARADRFLKAWPKSMFRANVEKVLAP